MKNWRKLLVTPDSSILKTIQVIDESQLQIAVVVGQDDQLLGTVTDGDIRRGIIKGVQLDQPVEKVMHRTPVTASRAESRAQILEKMTSRSLRHIPVVDEAGRLLRMEFFDEASKVADRPNWVVIMAGGQGNRLRPLTDNCPKPLLKVGDVPLLETTIRSLAAAGLRKIFLSVNYKAEMIQDFCGDGSRWNVEIQYVREETEMGTAGALSLLPGRPEHPVLVMNGDILTKVSYGQMLDFHAERQACATMAVREYDFQIPYGVVQLQQEWIRALEEKPIQRFFVSAGIYVINPAELAKIPRATHFDMPSLFRVLMEHEGRTAAFPIREYWLDIGQLSDFERAREEYSGQFGGD